MPTEEKKSTMPDQTLAPTSVDAWVSATPEQQIGASDEGFVVELPSGNVIRMTRTMDLGVLLKSGKIPNPLAGIVQGMIDSEETMGMTNEQFAAKFADRPKAALQLLDLVHETIVKVVLEPPFSMPASQGQEKDQAGKLINQKETAEQYQDRLAAWKKPEGTISVWEMFPEDRFYIFSVAQGAAADLARFRLESAGTVADVSNGKGVRKPTKRTNGAGSKKSR